MVKNRKKRVILGMSSGVDSSVSAALLKEKGYDVIGVFMHFWKEPVENSTMENKCCSLESLEDARKVCRVLDISLYTANAEKEFKKEVVDYFLHEYASGRTPNPCVACNEHIKFNVLLKKMLEMEGDYIATGHYARVEERRSENNEAVYHLFCGKDMKKDQSYFLYNLDQKQLARILFPVGDFEKSEIRKMAKKIGLPVFDKEDSQDLCFTAEKYPENFLKRNLEMVPGKIINTQGKIMGSHAGLPLYTIGQRRGINIGGDGPYYVVGKDMDKDVLLVTNDENDPALARREMKVERVNWIVKEPGLPSECLVKTRYRHPMVSAIIKGGKDGVYEVEFKEPQRAISPGQSAVFYDFEGEMMGGGRIKC